MPEVIIGPDAIFPTGSTGTPTSRSLPFDAQRYFVFELIVESVGGSPTATFVVEGSMDGTNWDSQAITMARPNSGGSSTTVTATGTYIFNSLAYKSSSTVPVFGALNWLRVRFTANTNVTFRGNAYYAGD